MGERGARRGIGAPFYAPPRRKTSAEIISEARAAIYGEMCAAGGNSSNTGAGGGAVRPLRTRRPFTPREPQRTLFAERSRKKDTRPPSAFDLKYLSLSENGEDLGLVEMGARVASLDEDSLNELLAEKHNAKKKPPVRGQQKPAQDRSGDGWGGFTRLPHLSGRSKPLHRRNTTGQPTVEESATESELIQAISIIRPLGGDNNVVSPSHVHGGISKSLSPETNIKRRNFAGNKSVSYDTATITNGLGDIPVKHLAVQLPNTSFENYENMSILELAEALSQRTRDVSHVVSLLDSLQNNLEKSTPANSLKDMVLRALYMHIDCEDERVLVAIARAMFTMKVTGSHLVAACKLVFKIARNDQNDHFFVNSNLLELLVEGCGRADPVSEGECCVYGAGALRFLALEPTLRARATHAGALHLAALHLKILNNARAESPRGVCEGWSHAVFQVCGALRSLAGGGGREARAFVASGALAELLVALTHHTDRDVLTNVARCLSVLSGEESCCAWLCARAGAAGAVVRALAACAARAPLAVRLAYTLGNMAAADHHARINIYNEEGSVDVLLTILESYTKRRDHDLRDTDSDHDLQLIGTDLGGSDGSNEDVLIKTVRVVANLCLAEQAGKGLADTYAERTTNALLACLALAEKPVTDEGLNSEERLGCAERREELATAALATLNNITFYRDPPDPPDPLADTLDKLCRAICRWVRGGGASAASCEAVRALGNVSREPRAAQLLVIEGALDLLLPFLEHEDASVRCASAGVLVNVCGAGVECARAGAVCARALGAAAGRHDARPAALLARALWNAHAHSPLPAAHAHHAATALNMFIDDDSVFAACEVSKISDRRASDPALLQNHVHFDIDNNNYDETEYKVKSILRTNSVQQDLQQQESDEDERNGYSGEDLGFEDGDIVGEEDCYCGPCMRLAAWEELVGVAIPLLEKLNPPRADASVGTE